MAGEPVTMEQINATVQRTGGKAASGRQADELLSALRAFVAQNEDPARSPNLADESPDDLSPLIGVLADPKLEDNELLMLHLLKVFKVLNR